MNPAQPPEGILDPKKPYWSADRVGEATWLRLKGNLTGRRVEGLSENFTSYVKLGNADADRLIENLKKWGKYPQLNQTDKSGGAYNAEAYQKWLVEEFLEKPFREEVDQKIEDRQAAREFAERLNKKRVKQAVELTTDVVDDPWGEATTPPKQYAVVPTTKLLPPAKETEEENKPEAKKKRGSSLAKSMTKTFARMETHFQKLSNLSEVSEGNITEISDAFRIQSAALSEGFLDTGTVIAKISRAVDLQTSTMIRIAKGKKDLDQKRLDAQEALNEETELEQQQSSSGNVGAKDIDKKSGPGGGLGGSIAKVLGGAVIGKVLTGKGIKLAKSIGGKTASKISGKVLEKALGKETAETLLKTAGREAAETGIEKGAIKFIGKKIPLVGLGIGTFLALERAAKGDFLGAGLELASGAASTIPGGGTAASIGIDAALMARDAGVVPFAEGGLTQKSTFTTGKKRPGVTDLSPDLFKKMYKSEIDYESRNKIKFGRLYAEGYRKYFDSPGLLGKIGGFLGGVVEFFKNVAQKLNNAVRRGARAVNDFLNPRTGTTTNQFKDVLPEGNPQLTSRFGPRRVKWGSSNHQGIDIGVDRGSRVLSLSDGTITVYDNATWNSFGQAVVVDHGDGTSTLYGHVDPTVKSGDKVKKGQTIAKVKFWPKGAYGATNDDNTHLHLERRLGGVGFQGRAVDPAQYLNERAGVADPENPIRTTGEYDVVIPLDHVPSHLAGKFPDDNAKTSFKQSLATGADGREREHQDKAAQKLKEKLDAKGLKVLILKPEDFKSYQDYDANIKAVAAKGTRILPLHFDASRSGGGTGFLTRTRSGDSADAAFAAPIQQALANFQSKNKDLGNISKDTASNATVNAGAASPTALVELGVMVDWEKKYGKNFTSSTKFNELIEALSNAILKTTKPRKPTPRVRPKNVRGGGTVYEAASSRQTQTDQLVAMASLPTDIETEVTVISVNNNRYIISMDQNGFDTESDSNAGFKDLHHARMV